MQQRQQPSSRDAPSRGLAANRCCCCRQRLTASTLLSLHMLRLPSFAGRRCGSSSSNPARSVSARDRHAPCGRHCWRCGRTSAGGRRNAEPVAMACKQGLWSENQPRRERKEALAATVLIAGTTSAADASRVPSLCQPALRRHRPAARPHGCGAVVGSAGRAPRRLCARRTMLSVSRRPWHTPHETPHVGRPPRAPPKRRRTVRNRFRG